MGDGPSDIRALLMDALSEMAPLRDAVDGYRADMAP